jgi:DNA-binding HxlR family transcriptional regulator
MKESVINTYLQELPQELVKAVKPLSNNKDLALFVCIMKEGPFRFNVLKEKFGAHQQELIGKLNSLIAAGLIERVTELSDESFAEVNHYTVSVFGESIMRSMVKGSLFIDSYSDSLRRGAESNYETNAHLLSLTTHIRYGNYNPWKRDSSIIIGSSNNRNTDTYKGINTAKV